MSRIAILATLVLGCAIGLGANTHAARAADPLIVTTTADTFDSVCDSDCSLRDAVFAANATGPVDTITFAIPGTGVKTINLTQGLTFTSPVLLDGTTQSGASCASHNLTIEIDGTNAGAADGITINHGGGNGTLIKGITVRDWNGHGIVIASGSLHGVRCSNIGTNAAGTSAAPNSGDGIRVLAAATGPGGISIGAIVGAGDPDDQERNIISGNTGAGINTAYAGGGGTLKISGNYIGTNASGTAAIANHGSGVVVTSGDAEIGLSGTNISAGNLISGNTGANTAGIKILSGATGTQVHGNVIGLNAAGTAAIANENGIIVGATSTFIGKTGTTGRNVISGNTGAAIEFQAGSAGSVSNNYIGTNAAGSGAVANGSGITSRAGITVGLSAPNVISGNTGTGVTLIGGGADNTQIVGNVIGYAANGFTPLPNGGNAVVVQGDTVGPISSVVIGSGAPQDANQIYARRPNSGQPLRNGIQVVKAPGDQAVSGVFIEGNSIDSDGLGIDLRLTTDPDNTPTANDANDADSGPNGFQNFPVVTEAVASPTPKIKGTIHSTANQQIQVAMYKSDSCSSASRIGQVYLGTTFAFTDPSGNYNWESMTLLGGFSGGDWITVTARAVPGHNTSEFSECFQAAGAAVHTISQFVPSDKIAGSGDFLLRVLGSNFTNSMQIQWNGQALNTTFVDDGELRATITTSLLGDTMQSRDVVVLNGQDESNLLAFPVRRSSSDVNCDGSANSVDALFLMQVIAGLATNNTACPSDVKQNGAANLGDVIWIRQDVAGLVEPLLSPQQ